VASLDIFRVNAPRNVPVDMVVVAVVVVGEVVVVEVSYTLFALLMS
jgi:hypothetical protein